MSPIPDLSEIAALLGAALLRASVCGGLALGLAWVVTRVMPRRSQ